MRVVSPGEGRTPVTKACPEGHTERHNSSLLCASCEMSRDVKRMTKNIKKGYKWLDSSYAYVRGIILHDE